MANKFTDSFNNNFNNSVQNENIFTSFNSFRQNPYGMLESKGINIPNEYRGNYQTAAQYLMRTMPQFQQNALFQRVNALRGFLGI